jgi:hypothetical protein
VVERPVSTVKLAVDAASGQWPVFVAATVRASSRERLSTALTGPIGLTDE